MEAFGAFADGEWDSFSSLFSSEDLDFTPHCLGRSSFPIEHDEGLNSNKSWFYSLDSFNSTLNCNKHESSYSTSSSQENICPFESISIPAANEICMFMNAAMTDVKNTSPFYPAFADIFMEETVCVNDGLPPKDQSFLKRKANGKVQTNPSENSEKRASDDVQKINKNNVGSKKRKKLGQKSNNIEVDNNRESDGHSSGSYTSEDDNSSPDATGGATPAMKKDAALNLNGKTRASRGSATDPQSLYARKRRERINERLRILQNLVPNGTKVDISTMLEEAVQYVKFLQLQIKLLSSDDLWMYAPIAYNGMDIGLHQNFSPLLLH